MTEQTLPSTSKPRSFQRIVWAILPLVLLAGVIVLFLAGGAGLPEVRNRGGSYSISFSIPSGNEWRISRLMTEVESAEELCKIWRSFLEHPEQYLDPGWRKNVR